MLELILTWEILQDKAVRGQIKVLPVFTPERMVTHEQVSNRVGVGGGPGLTGSHSSMWLTGDESLRIAFFITDLVSPLIFPL